MDEYLYPHTPDVMEREASDGGFSRGWGMHFIPTEKYWADVHAHIEIEHTGYLRNVLQSYKNVMDRLGVKYASIISPIASRAKMGSGFRELLEQGIDIVRDIGCLTPMLYIDYMDADPDIIGEAVKAGIKGIKLHNAPIIVEGESHKIWLSDEWSKVFKKISEYRLPVLWHVTQRLTDSPYTGGGRNTYWKEGWLKGVEYGNQDLLEVFLEVVNTYPDINFIGAHQLHMGWDMLTGLFNRYPNLSIDTSIGCIIREFDQIYEPDRDCLRDYFIDYSSKILFGTDTIVNKDMNEQEAYINYANHIRFIKQLRLPDEVLQKIAHENFERLFGL